MNKYIIKIGEGYYNGQSIFTPSPKSNAEIFMNKKNAEIIVSKIQKVLPAHEPHTVRL